MPSIQSAYNWSIETCAKENVGYSQTYRNQRTVNGITYYDCSSFIWYALIAGGWDLVSVLPREALDRLDNKLLDEHYDHDRAVKRFHIKEKSIIKELQEAGD